jgi:hypothetical protein
LLAGALGAQADSTSTATSMIIKIFVAFFIILSLLNLF